MNHEKRIRDAATELAAAIADGRKAGLAVAWPMTVDGLDRIAISATKKAASEQPSYKAEKPAGKK